MRSIKYKQFEDYINENYRIEGGKDFKLGHDDKILILKCLPSSNDPIEINKAAFKIGVIIGELLEQYRQSQTGADPEITLNEVISIVEPIEGKYEAFIAGYNAGVAARELNELEKKTLS